MRPRLNEKEKRKGRLIIRVTVEEKLRIKTMTRIGKYACMSDFIRARIFRNNNKREISFDMETSQQLKQLDFELNKIGVNLNQLSKRMNSHYGYKIGENDRQLLREAFEKMNTCLTFLQKNLR